MMRDESIDLRFAKRKTYRIICMHCESKNVLDIRYSTNLNRFSKFLFKGGLSGIHATELMITSSLSL